MRPTCIDKVFELAKRDARVAYIGSDLDPPLTRRMKEEMPGRAFMEGVSEQHVVGMAAFTLAFSFRYEGTNHVPANGPVLIVANHQSFVDPWVVGLAVTGAFLAWAVRGTHWSEVRAGLSAVDPVLLFVAVALATLTFPLRTIRWRVMLRNSDDRAIGSDGDL